MCFVNLLEITNFNDKSLAVEDLPNKTTDACTTANMFLTMNRVKHLLNAAKVWSVTGILVPAFHHELIDCIWTASRGFHSVAKTYLVWNLVKSLPKGKKISTHCVGHAY